MVIVAGIFATYPSAQPAVAAVVQAPDHTATVVGFDGLWTSPNQTSRACQLPQG
jgi:hypothetical protein